MMDYILCQLCGIFKYFKFFKHLFNIHFSFKNTAVISRCLQIKVVIHLNLVFQHIFNILNVFDYSNSNVYHTMLFCCLFYCKSYQVLYCFKFLNVEFSNFFKVFFIYQLNNTNWQCPIEFIWIIIIQDIFLMGE